MNIILLLIILIYQSIMSVMDMRDMKRLKNTEITEDSRIKFYKESIIWGWIPAGIVCMFVILTPLSFQELGLRKITLSDSVWLNSIILLVSAVIIIALLYQAVMYFSRGKYRQQVLEELRKQKESSNHYESIMTIVLPRSLKEKKYFFFVSLTAGICEEFVWRGCLIFLLTDIFPSLHMVVIIIMSCLLFGLFHCYQGLYGVIKTGIIAILFIFIYLTTASLVLGMVLHFMFDFSSAFLIREES